MLVRTMRLICLIGVFASCVACSEAPSRPGVPDPVAISTNRWTIMVYMAADNSLNTFSARDINEMEDGLVLAGEAARSGVDVIVLFDPRTQGDWTDTRLYRILPDTNLAAIASERLDDGVSGRGHCLPLGERNTGDGATLAWFMAYCRTNFPAQQYALILWNHGGGARIPARCVEPRSGGRASVGRSSTVSAARDRSEVVPQKKDRKRSAAVTGPNLPSREIAQDQNADDVIWLDELSTALAAHRDAVGPLALLGMDACLMGCFETAWEMRGLARILVASMANEPDEGWDYRRIMTALDEATVSGEGFATVIVDSYQDLHSPEGTAAGSGVTLSATACEKLGPVKTALDGLAKELALWIAPGGLVEQTRLTAFATLRMSANRFFE